MHLRSPLPLARILLAAITILGITSCQPEKPVKDPNAPPAAPDTSPIGTAQLTPEGTLRVMLLAAPDAEGKPAVIGQALHSYNAGTPEYDRYIKHVGGLTPGQSKPIPPFPSGR